MFSLLLTVPPRIRADVERREKKDARIAVRKGSSLDKKEKAYSCVV